MTVLSQGGLAGPTGGVYSEGLRRAEDGAVWGTATYPQEVRPGFQNRDRDDFPRGVPESSDWS